MDAPRRHYESQPSVKGRPPDRDAADSAYRLKMLAYSVPGAVIGALAGRVAAGRIGALIGFAAGFVFVYLVTALLMRSAAAAAGRVYTPSGASTPAVREYSQPQSLAARGLYADAISAYQRCAADYPSDPEPCFRIARLYLKELKRYDDAVAWFRRARAAGAIDAGRELVATQEIVDIYDHKLGEPRRAIPELARLVDRFPGTPAAAWASEQLRLRRASVVAEGAPAPPPDGLG